MRELLRVLNLYIVYCIILVYEMMLRPEPMCMLSMRYERLSHGRHHLWHHTEPPHHHGVSEPHGRRRHQGHHDSGRRHHWHRVARESSLRHLPGTPLRITEAGWHEMRGDVGFAVEEELAEGFRSFRPTAQEHLCQVVCLEDDEGHLYAVAQYCYGFREDLRPCKQQQQLP